jgi:ribosomal protein S27AE
MIKLPALPDTPYATSYFCNKCGYNGVMGPGHKKRQVSGEPCHYDALEAPKYTAAQVCAIQIAAARTALEVVAKVCEATYLGQRDGVYVAIPQCDGPDACAAAIRALRIEGETA